MHRLCWSLAIFLFIGVGVGCPADDSTEPTTVDSGNADGGDDAGPADTADAVCDYQGSGEGVCADQTRTDDGTCREPETYEQPEETVCDGLDNDCDGAVDEGCDLDGDGFCDAEKTVADDAPDEVCPNGGGDCWDEANSEAARRTFPGAAQLDSESECMQDVDDDEYGAENPSGPDAVAEGTDACDDQPRAWNADACSSCSDDDEDDYWAGCDTYLSQSEDCDDGDASVHPDATEACDGTDADCDGQGDAEDDDARDFCRDPEQTGWEDSECVQRNGEWCCTKQDGSCSG